MLPDHGIERRLGGSDARQEGPIQVSDLQQWTKVLAGITYSLMQMHSIC